MTRTTTQTTQTQNPVQDMGGLPAGVSAEDLAKAGWVETTLGMVVKTNSKTIKKDYLFEEILYLDTGSITKGQIGELQKIKLLKAPSRAKRLVKNFDIVYSTVRPNQEHYGFIENPKENLVVSTGFTVISAKQEKAFPKFLYYFLTQKNITDEMQQIAEHSVSTYPSIKPENLENLEISLPPLPEQKAIASILSSFDDKIELLREQNETLEAIGQSVFKEWFLNDSVKTQRLGDLVDVKRGGSPRPIKDYISNSGIRWLKISDASATKSPYIFIIKEHIKKEGLNKTTLLKAGSLVLSNSATPGIPKILAVDSCIHDGWLHFPKSKFSNEFLYLLFKEIRPQLIQQGSGSVFTNLKTDILKDYEAPFPSNKELQKFNQAIKPLFEKIKNNSEQIQTLSKTRDILLPKLMRGEVRVNF